MWTDDEINERDETLAMQLRLALASPLWKGLPYGAQVNPRSWRIEVLEARPGRRLCALITVPWKTGPAPEGSGLRFVALVWHNQQGQRLHRALRPFNERREAGGHGERRLMFYDALSHVFIVQYGGAHKGRRAAEGAAAPVFRPAWPARALRVARRTLKREQ